MVGEGAGAGEDNNHLFFLVTADVCSVPSLTTTVLVRMSHLTAFYFGCVMMKKLRVAWKPPGLHYRDLYRMMSVL